jgi:hypothetical protein
MYSYSMDTGQTSLHIVTILFLLPGVASVKKSIISIISVYQATETL